MMADVVLCGDTDKVFQLRKKKGNKIGNGRVTVRVE